MVENKWFILAVLLTVGNTWQLYSRMDQNTRVTELQTANTTLKDRAEQNDRELKLFAKINSIASVKVNWVAGSDRNEVAVSCQDFRTCAFKDASIHLVWTSDGRWAKTAGD